MVKSTPHPFIIERDGTSRRLERLPRLHKEFDELFLQELLVKHPELLPVQNLRDDVGQLLCIGREVTCGGSGAIDNLYLSTGGYPVVVETKLWRNPQARREVLSQVLDYTKEIVKKDFEWFQEQWRLFASQNRGKEDSLIAVLNELADDAIDESYFVDRVQRAIRRGDILSLIVGDGIETGLQQLVSHLCADSAHLRYSLALVEIVCYEMNQEGKPGTLVVVPRLIQDVDPVERAYVRVELAPALESQLRVQSVAEVEEQPRTGYRRSNLTEEELIAALDKAIGVEARKQLEVFYKDLIRDFELEADFRAATLMIKIPDPAGEKPGASVLAIEREGRIYNPNHFRNQLRRMGLEHAVAERVALDYWAALHRVDNRFELGGTSHFSYKLFIPMKEIMPKFDALRAEIERVAARVREVFGGSP